MKTLGEWLCALCIAAAVTISVYGAAETLFFPKKNPQETDLQAVSAVSADAFTIVVDAGHGGFDGGAVGTDTGVIEAELNLAVAERVSDRLTAKGMSVLMTRETDAALGKDKQSDMKARRDVFMQEDVDLVVSVHMNRFTDRAVSGPMAYYMVGSIEGQKAAQSVIDSLCDALSRPRRLANPGDYFVVRECSGPAVLVECGFLSNAAEEQKLLDPAYQALLAEAVAEGLFAYLSLA